MPLVVDASVAVKWYIREPDSDVARKLLTGPYNLVAPASWLVEVTNALWANVRQANMTVEDGRRSVELLGRSPVRIVPVEGLLQPAFEIATTRRHPVYDCIYVATAQAVGCQLVTADRPLINAMKGPEFGSLVLPLASLT